LTSAVPVKKILTGAAQGDEEHISKVGEGERKESKIFDKQTQNKKITRGKSQPAYTPWYNYHPQGRETKRTQVCGIKDREKLKDRETKRTQVCGIKDREKLKDKGD